MQLPKKWPRHVRSAIVHAISMGRVAFTVARTEAEHHWNERIRLRSRFADLERKNRLLVEELRIKDARMAQIDPRHRPHYPPAERLAILELRAACGWSQEETARRFHVSPLTIHNWMQRLDDEGPDALIRVPVPVNRFPDFVSLHRPSPEGALPEDGDAPHRRSPRAREPSSRGDDDPPDAEASGAEAPG